MKSLLLGLSFLVLGALRTAVQPEVAEINFDARCLNTLTFTNGLPAWVQGVEQDGGQFTEQPACWQAAATQPTAVGRVSILLNRALLQEDVALAILSEHDEEADFVVQLFDAQNRIIVLDLFGNIAALGKEAKTDTFIVPLRRFPSATKITLRRVRGEIRVRGVVLYPVLTPARADQETLAELARLMGDELSPDNPLVKGINRLSKGTGVEQQWAKSVLATNSGVAAAGKFKPLESVNQQVGGGWQVLPFYTDSDWPASRGEPSVVGRNDILLRGRAVRSLSSYRVPATIECDVELQERAASDGSFDLFVVPEGVSAERYPDPMTNLRMIYSNTGDYGSVDRLEMSRLDDGRGQLLWNKPQKLEAGVTYHVKLSLDAEGRIQLQINNRDVPLPESVRAPYRNFHVQVGGWQPTNRWHMRNFTVR